MPLPRQVKSRPAATSPPRPTSAARLKQNRDPKEQGERQGLGPWGEEIGWAREDKPGGRTLKRGRAGMQGWKEWKCACMVGAELRPCLEQTLLGGTSSTLFCLAASLPRVQLLHASSLLAGQPISSAQRLRASKPSRKQGQSQTSQRLTAVLFYGFARIFSGQGMRT